MKRIIDLENKYESKIYVIDEEKVIYKIDCLCGDFVNRKIRSVGKGYNKRFYAEPCKHLKKVVEVLQGCGYTLKKPQEQKGEIKLSRKLRDEILKRANYMCEECDSEESLEVHRITPKTHGGLYSLDNCKLLCKKCHDQRNSYLHRNF